MPIRTPFSRVSSSRLIRRVMSGFQRSFRISCSFSSYSQVSHQRSFPDSSKQFMVRVWPSSPRSSKTTYSTPVSGSVQYSSTPDRCVNSFRFCGGGRSAVCGGICAGSVSGSVVGAALEEGACVTAAVVFASCGARVGVLPPPHAVSVRSISMARIRASPFFMCFGLLGTTIFSEYSSVNPVYFTGHGLSIGSLSVMIEGTSRR